MVSFLDIGLLNYFAIIFPALLIFFLVFAILEKTKIFGEKKTVINAVISIAIAMMIIMLKDIVAIIRYMVPWFVIIFIFLILLLIVLKIMGASDETIANMLAKNKTVQYVLIGVGFIILIAAIAHVYGERLLPVTEGGEIANAAEEGSFKQNVFQVLFNPMILGVLFVLILAVFAIGLLTRERV
jgi:CDP-diglyceride synthetase